MKNSICVLVRSAALSVLLMTVQHNSFACSIHQVDSGKLFDREFKQQSSQQVAKGPMILQDDDDDEYTKGYRPKSSVLVSGTFCQEVYDFDANLSAHELFHSIKKSQADAGYQVGFECEGEACGDIDGWRLFLSEHIAGSTQDQKFLMTFLGGDDFFVISNMIHINEFDDQPRVTVTTIFRPEALRLSLVGVGTDLFDSNYDSDVFELTEVGTLYFASNVADDYDQGRLGSIANQIKDDDANARFLVIGYTDTDGTSDSNQQLSLARANSVAQNLFDQHQVDKSRLHIIGKGEVSGSERARKVTVYRVPIN